MSPEIRLVSGDSLSLSLCCKTGFCRIWGYCPPSCSISVFACHQRGWRESSQERWVWGRRAPWAQALAQTLIYMMLTDVILLQSLSLSFTDPDIFSVLSVKPRRGGRCPAMAGLHACRMIHSTSKLLLSAYYIMRVTFFYFVHLNIRTSFDISV